MGLIKIEEFSGSEIANTVIEALETIGVVNKLNINGYHLSITGIQEPTPKGLIDDMPNKHTVCIERNKFAMHMSNKEYRQFSKDNEQYTEVLNKMKEGDIPFKVNEGIDIECKLIKDDNGLWYKHQIKFNIDKTVLETLDGYVKRIFEHIANYVVETFDSMC